MNPSLPTGASAISQANPFLDISTEESIRLLRRGFDYRAAFGFVLFLAFGIAYLIPIGTPPPPTNPLRRHNKAGPVTTTEPASEGVRSRA